jgi:hypothetical protein
VSRLAGVSTVKRIGARETSGCNERSREISHERTHSLSKAGSKRAEAVREVEPECPTAYYFSRETNHMTDQIAPLHVRDEAVLAPFHYLAAVPGTCPVPELPARV